MTREMWLPGRRLPRLNAHAPLAAWDPFRSRGVWERGGTGETQNWDSSKWSASSKKILSPLTLKVLQS